MLILAWSCYGSRFLLDHLRRRFYACVHGVLGRLVWIIYLTHMGVLVLLDYGMWWFALLVVRFSQFKFNEFLVDLSGLTYCGWNDINLWMENWLWDLGTSFTAVDMGYNFSKSVQLVGDSRMIIYRLLLFWRCRHMGFFAWTSNCLW